MSTDHVTMFPLQRVGISSSNTSYRTRLLCFISVCNSKTGRLRDGNSFYQPASTTNICSGNADLTSSGQIRTFYQLASTLSPAVHSSADTPTSTADTAQPQLAVCPALPLSQLLNRTLLCQVCS